MHGVLVDIDNFAPPPAAERKNKYLPEVAKEIVNALIFKTDIPKHKDPGLNTFLRFLRKRIHIIQPLLINKVFAALAAEIIIEALVNCFGIEYYYDEHRAQTLITEGKLLTANISAGQKVDKDYLDSVLTELKLIDEAREDGSTEVVQTTQRTLRIAVEAAIRKVLVYLTPLVTFFGPLNVKIKPGLYGGEYNTSTIADIIYNIRIIISKHHIMKKVCALYKQLGNRLNRPRNIILTEMGRYSLQDKNAIQLIQMLLYILPNDSTIIVPDTVPKINIKLPIQDPSSILTLMSKLEESGYYGPRAKQHIGLSERIFSGNYYDNNLPTTWIMIGVHNKQEALKRMNKCRKDNHKYNIQTLVVKTDTNFTREIVRINQEMLWQGEQEQLHQQ